MDEVIESRPGDSATLQAVYMYCRELGDCKLIGGQSFISVRQEDGGAV